MIWTSLLLADPSPCLRLRVLIELLNRPTDDSEVCELREIQGTDPWVMGFLDLQNEDGSFRGAEPGTRGLGPVRLTAQALMGLGYLGLSNNHPAVQRGAAFIFSHQEPDGSFPLTVQGSLLDGGRVDDDVKYHMIPLQTALPLLGLAWSGFSTDKRTELAYDWLLNEELQQGGWPSGRHKDRYVHAGGYRRLAHSKFGCRTNTTAVVAALALHPTRRFCKSSRRGLDMLLAHQHRQETSFGFEVARLVGVERPRGAFTYFKRYDVAQILDLSWRIGANLDDERVAENVKFVNQLKGPYGIWNHKKHPEISRWVSFDILRSLARLIRKRIGLAWNLGPRSSHIPKNQSDSDQITI